jgi:adenylate cyclase
MPAGLGRGHGQLQQQPESPEGLRQEISLLQELGSTRFAIKGYGDEDAARAFQRMRELAERLDVAPLRLRAMQGLLLVHTMRAGFTTARAVGEEMLALASELGNPVAIANTRVTLGAILLNLGELDAARQHGEHVRSLIDSERLPAVFAISSCCLLASACAHLGLLQQARAMVDEALARAATYAVPYLRAHATNFAAQTCAILRDVTRARSLAEETLRLASEYGFSVFRISATMVRGWCDVEDGRVAKGLAALRGAFQEYGTSGQRISTTSFSILLAGAHLASGDGAAATKVLHDALGFASETGERVNEPELHRLQGECLLQRDATGGHQADARACFERALAIAANRRCLLFELRAAHSLYRIGGTPDRDRLARLVDRFGPEEDSADLRAARITCGVNTRPLLSC